LLLLPAFFFYASYSISSGVYVKAYCRKKTTEKEIALTFDDGPDSVQTPRILDVLEKWKVEAAFFCIGSKVEKNRQLIAEMQEKGHLVGNHSYSHVTSFPLFSTRRMIADIQRSEEALKLATGKPVKFFRPPFGVTNPLLRKALKAFDYYVIGWDVRSLDTSIADVDKVVNRIVKKLRPGSIILLHDPLPHSEQILTKILIYLSDNGYTIKRVDKLFNII
jgi:peptidoglycan/xylan/chitin deacetylase (PgdA/CDA1 family)